MTETLLIFKSGRRQEYLQENLLVLSGARGDDFETSFANRWVDPGLVERPPVPGMRCLVLLAERPYTRAIPVRFGELAQWTPTESNTGLVIRLGRRATTNDPKRWEREIGMLAGPGAGVFLRRLPVELESVAQEVKDGEEGRAWERQVERISRFDGYERSVFLRVGQIRDADTDLPVDQPFELEVARSYVVSLESRNQHLGRDLLRDLRLVPFNDPLRVQLAYDEGAPLPPNGNIDMLLRPMATRLGTVELHAARGAEFAFAFRLAWMGIPAVDRPEGPVSVPGPVEGLVEPVVKPVVEPAVEPVVEPVPPAIAQVDAAMRVYALLQEIRDTSPELRRRVLQELTLLVPDARRLQEEQAAVLFELGRFGEARTILEAIPQAEMSQQARAVMTSTWLRSGWLPEPVSDISVADLTRPGTLELLLEASQGLAPADLVRLSQYVTDEVLSDERAARWLEVVLARDLPRAPILQLLEAWKYADPSGAARSLEGAVDGGRLQLSDPATAELALELGVHGDRPGLARAAAIEVSREAERRSDREALERLLERVVGSFAVEDRRELVEMVARSVANVAPEEARIDSALNAVSTLLEDHRQRGELDRASSLAVFLTANRHRGSESAQARLDLVVETLREAIDASATFRRFEELRAREANLDLREQVAGLRLLLVGGKRPEWWDDVRNELGISARSDWMESEAKKAPDGDAVDARLRSGSWDAVVLLIGRVGHKVSKPITAYMKDHDVPLVNVPRPSRDSFIAALRAEFVRGDRERQE